MGQLYLKDFRSTVALTFATSKVLYMRHCPCTHNYENYVTFEVVQFTSQITSTSNKVGGRGTEVDLITLKCQMDIPILFVETASKGITLYLDLRNYTVSCVSMDFHPRLEQPPNVKF